MLALYPAMVSFIAVWGGRRFRPGELAGIVARLEDPLADMFQPQLLFSAEERRQVERYFSIAQEGETSR